MLAHHRTMREQQAGLDVLGFEHRVLLQELLGRISCRQHPENMLDGLAGSHRAETGVP